MYFNWYKTLLKTKIIIKYHIQYLLLCIFYFMWMYFYWNISILLIYDWPSSIFSITSEDFLNSWRIFFRFSKVMGFSTNRSIPTSLHPFSTNSNLSAVFATIKKWLKFSYFSIFLNSIVVWKPSLTGILISIKIIRNFLHYEPHLFLFYTISIAYSNEFAWKWFFLPKFLNINDTHV